jgi:hypothetical protein
MSYITSVERIGIEKGIKQGIEQGILQTAREDIIEALTIRFEAIPQALIEAIETLEDSAILKKLFRQAILVESLEEFKQVLDSLLGDNANYSQTLPDPDDANGH